MVRAEQEAQAEQVVRAEQEAQVAQVVLEELVLLVPSANEVVRVAAARYSCLQTQ